MRLRRGFVVAGSVLWISGGLLAQAPVVGGQYQANSQQPEVKTVTRVEPRATRLTESAPQPLGYETNVYCFGYIGPPHEVFPYTIVSAESLIEQSDFTTSDLMYLDHGLDRGLKVGDEFWIVTEEDDVYHPKTNHYLGRFYRLRGRAVTLSVEERTATVRISSSCTDVPVLATLKPFEPIPIPLARKTPPAVAGDPPSGKATGYIVQAQDGVVCIGSDSVILVDMGADKGVQPGDFLTIFRYAAGREYGIRPVGAAWITKEPPPGMQVPRTYLGEIAVLFVGDRWAVGRVSDSYRLIEVGDQVELK